MGRRIFDLDLSRCIGCFACVVACNDQHDTQEEETPSLRRVVRYEDMGTGSTKFVSVGCMHCEEAPCALWAPGKGGRCWVGWACVGCWSAGCW